MDSLRCCISCILPCGSLDVIRIVHVNGRVEEITGTIYAAQILKAHPKHILKKPITSKLMSEDIIDNSSQTSSYCRPTIVVVPPEARLQRGKIYFLIPVAKPPASGKTDGGKKRRYSKKENKVGPNDRSNNSNSNNNNYDDNNNNSKNNDKYLSEILSEQVSSQKEKRRGRVAVWRPHLESIVETLSDNGSNDK